MSAICLLSRHRRFSLHINITIGRVWVIIVQDKSLWYVCRKYPISPCNDDSFKYAYWAVCRSRPMTRDDRHTIGGRPQKICLSLHHAARSCSTKMLRAQTEAQENKLSNDMRIAIRESFLEIIHSSEGATTPFFWVGLSTFAVSHVGEQILFP